jgi:hypothetical protein
MSIQDYVIGGMDPDFRELLYYAGLAMDRAGISWTILSGFRDDYRQEIAVGLKAHTGKSLHGGSIATGGYGHGCAVDIDSVDGLSNQQVWRWMADHGAEFGLRRPLPQRDPAHVQPQGAWHELAAAFRRHRMGEDAGETAADQKDTNVNWAPIGDFSASKGDPCTTRQPQLDPKNTMATAKELTNHPFSVATAHLLKPHGGELPANSRNVSSEVETKPKTPPVAGPLHAMWFVQLAGGRSEPIALGTYYRVQRKFDRILGPYRPVVARAAGKARWYRARIALNSRSSADKLCNSLRSAGGDCIVLAN